MLSASVPPLNLLDKILSGNLTITRFMKDEQLSTFVIIGYMVTSKFKKAIVNMFKWLVTKNMR